MPPAFYKRTRQRTQREHLALLHTHVRFEYVVRSARVSRACVVFVSCRRVSDRTAIRLSVWCSGVVQHQYTVVHVSLGFFFNEYGNMLINKYRANRS